MGNVPNNALNGKRFATAFPKTPKPPKCRVCGAVAERDELVRIGGSRYHPHCRKATS